MKVLRKGVINAKPKNRMSWNIDEYCVGFLITRFFPAMTGDYLMSANVFNISYLAKERRREGGKRKCRDLFVTSTAKPVKGCEISRDGGQRKLRTHDRKTNLFYSRALMITRWFLSSNFPCSLSVGKTSFYEIPRFIFPGELFHYKNRLKCSPYLKRS